MSNQIILYDTEYTAWEGSWRRKWSEPWEHREIIQIAAIRVELSEEMPELASFDCLVKPRINPMLSPYIVELTGIRQAEVDARGVCFADAFAAFYRFAGEGRIPLYSYGDDPGVLAENFVLNEMPAPAFPAGIHDIRAVFEQAGIDTGKYTSGTVHKAVGVESDHAAHNALNDVRSLAVTIRQLALMGKVHFNGAEKGHPSFAGGTD